MANETMSLSEQKEELSLDARLLSDAITELNICRHKVAIYPKDHPAVGESLRKGFDFLEQLFELRSEISLKVAKDVLIIDDYYLEKGNPIYREFASCLHLKNIACVTFTGGLTREELYTFHQFISADAGEAPLEKLQEEFKALNLLHVKLGFIDYGAFSFKEGKSGEDTAPGHLWERYVKGLIEGTLRAEAQLDAISEIPPEIFSQLVNETATDSMTSETYDRVVATYVRKSSERAFTGTDLKKIMIFINRLRPELKKQFLSSSFKTFPRDIDSAEKILGEIPADEAIALLNTINEQKVSIPEAIKKLLEKLSMLTPEGFEGRMSGDNLIVDDIPLAHDIAIMLSEDNFTSFVTDAYSKEIQALLEFDASALGHEEFNEFETEWSDETIEKDFNQTLLELISSDRENLITESNCDYFNSLLKDQIEHFIGTGQYDQVLKIFSIVQANCTDTKKPLVDVAVLSPELISLLVDSFRIVGSQNSKDVMRLCEYCGEKIVPPLLEALMKEESRRIRKFLLTMIIHLGTLAVPEVIKYLADSRWFVKRNMLYILSECGGSEALPHVKPYCYHNNPKVRFQALRYLLNTERLHGIEVLKNSLSSEEKEIFEMALTISGAFRVKEVVPDLITLLKKMAKRGSDFDHKIPIVKALGQIGDPRALDTLNHILASKSLLYKGPLQRLKDEISSTLKYYPGNKDTR
jgi:hypothetical protein